MRVPLFFLIAGPLLAQPQIFYRGIVNAASSMPAGLPAGSIAQGSIFSIYGSGLGPAAGQQVNAFPLEPDFAGVSVQVQQGATSLSAIPIYVSASQLNVIMPSNTPTGKVQVRVSYQSATSNPASVNVVPVSFGIFTLSGFGFGPGVLQNFVSATQVPVNSLTNSATPGQIMVLYGTGLGAVASDVTSPAADNLPAQVTVFVGGVSAQASYSGRSPCCSGLDQIVFQIPTSAPTGCYVPVQVQTNGTVVSNAVTIAISSGGGNCSDPLNPQVSQFVSGAAMGLISLSRTLTEWQGAAGQSDLASDYGAGLFFQPSASPWFFNPAYSAPASGSCMVYAGAGDYMRGTSIPGTVPAAGELNAGISFSVTGTGGTATVPSIDNAGRLGGYLGATGFDGQTSGSPLPGAILGPGAISASGGGDSLGVFEATANASAPLTWTNRDQVTTVPRSQPLALTWSGGTPATDQVFVSGVNSDLPSNSSAGFVCSVPQGQQSFTIPAYVLANLPATHAATLPGILLISDSPANAAAAFSASGISAGYITYGSVSKKTVVFQ